MKSASAVLAFVATLASATSLTAQPSTAPATTPAAANPPASQAIAAPQIPPTTAADRSWPEVVLNVVVTGKHDLPQAVDQHKFQLFEDGVERPLRFPASPDSPISLAILIDLSNSTFEHTPEIISAVKTIVRALPAKSEVTVTDVSSGLAFLDVPFTLASTADLSVLDKLQPNGATDLWDTLVDTESYLAAEAKYPRRALVIFSDGLDNVSYTSALAASRAMQQPGAPLVYSCFVAKINFMPSRFGLLYMKRIAKEGGGMLFSFNRDLRVDPDPAAAAAVAAQIAAAINHQYVLQFTAADTARNGMAHKLKLQGPDKDTHVHITPSYYAPAP